MTVIGFEVFWNVCYQIYAAMPCSGQATCQSEKSLAKQPLESTLQVEGHKPFVVHFQVPLSEPLCFHVCVSTYVLPNQGCITGALLDDLFKLILNGAIPAATRMDKTIEAVIVSAM